MNRKSTFTKAKAYYCLVLFFKLLLFFFPVKSAHLPIQLQCSCPFASVIKVGGVSYLSPGGQWTPAENTYPGIEAAADQECRQQQENEMRKCDLYLKDLNVHLHSEAKLAISYDCFADNNDFDTGK